MLNCLMFILHGKNVLKLISFLISLMKNIKFSLSCFVENLIRNLQTKSLNQVQSYIKINFLSHWENFTFTFNTQSDPFLPRRELYFVFTTFHIIFQWFWGTLPFNQTLILFLKDGHMMTQNEQVIIYLGTSNFFNHEKKIKRLIKEQTLVPPLDHTSWHR